MARCWTIPYRLYRRTSTAYMRTTTMARKKKLILSEPLRNRLNTIKVRLDARTVITIGNIKALEFWKQRYPLAEVIA